MYDCLRAATKRTQQYNANPPPNMTLLKTIPAHNQAITCMAYDQATNQVRLVRAKCGSGALAGPHYHTACVLMCHGTCYAVGGHDQGHAVPRAAVGR